MYLAFPYRYVPNVEVIHRNIEIAAEQDVRIYIARLVEKPSKTLDPIQLESEFVAPELAPVRDVRVDDTNTVDGPGDQTLMRFVVIVEEILDGVMDTSRLSRAVVTFEHKRRSIRRFHARPESFRRSSLSLKTDNADVRRLSQREAGPADDGWSDVQVRF